MSAVVRRSLWLLAASTLLVLAVLAFGSADSVPGAAHDAAHHPAVHDPAHDPAHDTPHGGAPDSGTP